MLTLIYSDQGIYFMYGMADAARQLPLVDVPVLASNTGAAYRSGERLASRRLRYLAVIAVAVLYAALSCCAVWLNSNSLMPE